jgi:ribosomal protein S18 acetylase RimI-like enzyme
MRLERDRARGRTIRSSSVPAPVRALPLELLDNVVWNTLNGPHARFAAGTTRARRYAQGFSPIVGFVDQRDPAFDDLAAHCAPDEHFYCDGWSGPAPGGWRIDHEARMVKMVWRRAAPHADPAPDARPLERMHADQALALAQLTRPGPFGPRTIELGEYFGAFDDGRLIAMAGERMCAGTLREISGVCTHPEYQGRGLARALMFKLVRRQMHRGEVPFLHVMSDNTIARELYARMGFEDYRETVVRVVSRAG